MQGVHTLVEGQAPHLIKALGGKHSRKVVLVAEAAAPGVPVIVPCVGAVLLKHLHQPAPIMWECALIM